MVLENSKTGKYFNSQPHKEADADSEETRMVVGYFNSQPHKEADSDCQQMGQQKLLFQLTASQGG